MPYIELRDTSQVWSLSSYLNSEQQKVIKVPIAKLGTWLHDAYGKVQLTEEDFNQVVNNWREGKAGYEPPLFIGHPVGGGPTVDGEPSAGWPDRIYHEDGVLYGEYSPTSEQLFTDVENEVYRYASAELVRNATDKETGEQLGTLLVGVALTNRPFIPLREHTVSVVERFSTTSDAQVEPSTLFVFDLQPQQNYAPMETQVTPVSQEPTPTTSTTPTEVAPTPAPQVFSEQAAPTVSKSEYDKLAEQFSKLAANYEVLQVECKELKQSFSDIRKREEEKALQEKLSKLQALNLPAETKETFSNMLTSGQLSPEAEAQLFSSYQTLSDTYGKAMQQQGLAQQKEQAFPVEVPLPEVFSDVIARNKKVIEARQQAAMSRAAVPVL